MSEAEYAVTAAEASLGQIPDLAWAMLAEGVARGRAPFHTPVLATVAAGGPQARTVVLRGADPDTRTVACHTDKRSPKVGELVSEEALTWVFYDRNQKIQLRLWGQARLHAGDRFARERWDTSRPGSRECYRGPQAPGAEVTAPEEALPMDVVDGYANFTVVSCIVDKMDWLYLNAAGHRRARFDWREGQWQGSWVAP